MGSIGISIGTLTDTQKAHYTAVLRGNLNLGAARFKHGCTGMNLDVLARTPLWELGLDYNHGTGHGVGYLLNVHEGPNAIRFKEAGGKAGAVREEGMITANEPGLYLEGQYGIRVENLSPGAYKVMKLAGLDRLGELRQKEVI